MENSEKIREKIDFDILYIGAGPASLSSALHLLNLMDLYNKKNEKKMELNIGIIDKASELGAHTLSGAVLDPKALAELIPGFEKDGLFKSIKVERDEVYYLTKKNKLRFPIVPPQLKNDGNYIISLSNFVKWLGKIVSKKGVDVFFDSPGQDLLFENNKLTGIKVGEKGLDKNNEKKPNYEPGTDIIAKVIVFAEGVHGSLTKKLAEKLGLRDGKNPQNYAVGVKEIWEIDKVHHKSGLVIHTAGYPSSMDTYGGGFIYHMENSKIAVGYSVGLDYHNPLIDPHEELQKFKLHPVLKETLINGKLAGYGAKCIPEGGYYSISALSGDGFLIIGDSAGFLNSGRLKGIHLAMKSGMLAAETIFNSFLKNDFSKKSLSQFGDLIKKSWIYKELYKTRNFHQGFNHGLITGVVNAGLGLVSGGKGCGFKQKLSSKDDYLGIYKKTAEKNTVKFDGILTFDKPSCLYHSGTKHEENQPCHIEISDMDNICNKKCISEYGNPCQYFCPGNVYEMVEDETAKNKTLKINASNCLHCKTCDIKDPYQVVNWTVPEEGGPNYKDM